MDTRHAALLAFRTVEVSTETAVQDLIRAGTPPQMAEGVAKSFEAIRDGRGATVLDTVERMTGNPPVSFEAWAREHASQFA